MAYYLPSSHTYEYLRSIFHTLTFYSASFISIFTMCCNKFNIPGNMPNSPISEAFCKVDNSAGLDVKLDI